MRISDWSSDVCSSDLCVPIHHLMEDAATAEIARAQLWQWLHHADGSNTDALEFPDHAPIDFALFDHAVATHTHRLHGSQYPGAAHADAAAALLSAMTRASKIGRASGRERVCPYV